MDNMAYLQQIAGVDNSVAQRAQKGDNPLKKIFNVWTLIGLVVLTLVICVTAVIVNSMNKVDTKDQDLMAESYWTSHYLSDSTIKDYSKYVKNSDIRSMTSSLEGVLREIKLNYNDLLKTKFGVEVAKMKPKEDAIPMAVLELNTQLNSTLEDARLNGILDRVFLREMTMQIAYLQSYQSEIAERTKDEDVKVFATKAEANLENIYNQFHGFKSITL
jgi:hypothetical protein